MSIFVESLWIWLGIALLIGAVGFSIYSGTRNRKAFFIAEGLALIVIVVGFLLVHFVETDHKSIAKMLDGLIAAVEKDDVSAVKKFISPSASSTIIKAESNMKLVEITRARYSDLEVEVNHFTSPPRARISFTAVVRFKFKSTAPWFQGPQQDVVRVRFSAVELEKVNGSWLVSDVCEFHPSAT